MLSGERIALRVAQDAAIRACRAKKAAATARAAADTTTSAIDDHENDSEYAVRQLLKELKRDFRSHLLIAALEATRRYNKRHTGAYRRARRRIRVLVSARRVKDGRFCIAWPLVLVCDNGWNWDTRTLMWRQGISDDLVSLLCFQWQNLGRQICSTQQAVNGYDVTGAACCFYRYIMKHV